MKAVAKPRVIEDVQYKDPVEYIVSVGFGAQEARAVINAYKAFYAKGLRGKGSWLDYVVANTAVKDEVRATAIMRLYRKFYGK